MALFSKAGSGRGIPESGAAITCPPRQRRNFSGKQSLTTRLRGVHRRMKSSSMAVRVLTTKSGKDLTKRRETRQNLSGSQSRKTQTNRYSRATTDLHFFRDPPDL